MGFTKMILLEVVPLTACKKLTNERILKSEHCGQTAGRTDSSEFIGLIPLNRAPIKMYVNYTFIHYSILKKLMIKIRLFKKMLLYFTSFSVLVVSMCS